MMVVGGGVEWFGVVEGVAGDVGAGERATTSNVYALCL